MPGGYSKYIRVLNSVGDIFFLNLSGIIAYFLRYNTFDSFFDKQYLSLFLYANLAWLTAAFILNPYNLERFIRVTTLTSKVLKHIILFVLLLETTLNITKSYFFSRTFLTYFYITLTIIISGWRVGLLYLLKYYRSKGYNFRQVVIIGYNKASKDLRDYFASHPELGYRFQGFFDNSHKNSSSIKGGIEDIENYVMQNNIDEIYCSPYELKREQVVQLIDFADNNLVRLKFIPDTGFNLKKFKVDFYDLLPVIVLRTIPLDDMVNKIIKRFFDIIFSILVLIFILSWLLPFLAILIKLDSKGPIFFKQQRSGINNDSFWCWKLRSMYVNNDANTKQAIKNDSRITPIGAFLRKTSLDELPQFFNVLIGYMSVVGPRPHMLKHTEEYAQMIDKFMVRHFVKPGITGLSQVMGYRGDTNDNNKMKRRVKIDIFYLENWSFLLDIKIIFLTIVNIFKGDDNAY